jgi:hypothetical protein
VCRIGDPEYCLRQVGSSHPTSDIPADSAKFKWIQVDSGEFN